MNVRFWIRYQGISYFIIHNNFFKTAKKTHEGDFDFRNMKQFI
jgi:hypothetical protein